MQPEAVCPRPAGRSRVRESHPGVNRTRGAGRPPSQQALPPHAEGG